MGAQNWEIAGELVNCCRLKRDMRCLYTKKLLIYVERSERSCADNSHQQGRKLFSVLILVNEQSSLFVMLPYSGLMYSFNKMGLEKRRREGISSLDLWQCALVWNECVALWGPVLVQCLLGLLWVSVKILDKNRGLV